MTKKLIIAAVLILISIASSTIAQDASGTPIQKLAQRILERLPDRRYTAHALGRGDDRKWRAFRHAEAAYAAADAYKKEWLEIAQQNEWEFFDPERDLAPLITAVAYRESSLREIVPVKSIDDHHFTTYPLTNELMAKWRAYTSSCKGFSLVN